MDLYLKIFLINFVLFVFTCLFDRAVLDDFLEESDYTELLFSIWALATLFSVPICIIYILITL